LSDENNSDVITPDVITPDVITPDVITPDVITPDVITPEVISEDVSETNNPSKESKHNDNVEKTSEDLSKLLDLEKQKSSQFEEKIKT
jgi:hypothetical protein